MTGAVTLVVDQVRRRAPGGTGTYVRGLLAGLDARRAVPGALPRVRLLAGRPPAGAPDELDVGLELATSRLPSRLLTRAWSAGIVSAPRGTALLHATSFAFPRARGVPFVATVHDLLFERHPELFTPRGRAWHRRALAAVLERADVFVVPSAPTVDQLLDAGAERGRIRLLPLGLDHIPAPSADPRAAARALGVPGPFVLSVGTLEPRKNLARVIEAFEAVRATERDLSLLLVGPHGWGSLPEAHDGVILAGTVGAGGLADLYAACDAFVYVPLVEGYGLPPLEALRAGAPVVTSAVPSLASAGLDLAAEQAVRVVDPTDVDAVAGALAAAFGGPRPGPATRAVLAGMRWTDTADAVVGLWRELGVA